MKTDSALSPAAANCRAPLRECARAMPGKMFSWSGLTRCRRPGDRRFPHDWVSLGEAGKCSVSCATMVAATFCLPGGWRGPNFSRLKTDAKGILLLPRDCCRGAPGDDALLRALMDILAERRLSRRRHCGCRPGSARAGRAYWARRTRSRDQARHCARHEGGSRAGRARCRPGRGRLRWTGARGRSGGRHGRDDHARRRACRKTFAARRASRRGVLVKALKPTQDGKTDLPVIGHGNGARMPQRGSCRDRRRSRPHADRRPQQVVAGGRRAGLCSSSVFPTHREQPRFAAPCTPAASSTTRMPVTAYADAGLRRAFGRPARRAN